MKSVLFTIVVCCTFGLSPSAFGSGAKMKGPDTMVHTRARASEASREIETLSVTLTFLGAIRLYQTWISPIGGRDRCGFRPTCSEYACEAIEEQGPITGLFMTADRLIRCNIWKKRGPDYTLLPNGKLYDPPSKNLLLEQ